MEESRFYCLILDFDCRTLINGHNNLEICAKISEELKCGDSLGSNNCVLNMVNFILFFPSKSGEVFSQQKGRNDKNNILSLSLCIPKAIKNVRGLDLIQTCNKIFSLIGRTLAKPN